MSHVAFVKKLIVDGDGKFNVLRLEAETESELNRVRDTYLSGDYQDATEAEYQAESDERDERQAPKAVQKRPRSQPHQKRRPLPTRTRASTQKPRPYEHRRAHPRASSKVWQ